MVVKAIRSAVCCKFGGRQTQTPSQRMTSPPIALDQNPAGGPRRGCRWSGVGRMPPMANDTDFRAAVTELLVRPRGSGLHGSRREASQATLASQAAEPIGRSSRLLRRDPQRGRFPSENWRRLCRLRPGKMLAAGRQLTDLGLPPCAVRVRPAHRDYWKNRSQRRVRTNQNTQQHYPSTWRV